jgi:hypothetical protein
MIDHATELFHLIAEGLENKDKKGQSNNFNPIVNEGADI